jgi:hypothetical protein
MMARARVTTGGLCRFRAFVSRDGSATCRDAPHVGVNALARIMHETL